MARALRVRSLSCRHTAAVHCQRQGRHGSALAIAHLLGDATFDVTAFVADPSYPRAGRGVTKPPAFLDSERATASRGGRTGNRRLGAGRQAGGRWWWKFAQWCLKRRRMRAPWQCWRLIGDSPGLVAVRTQVEQFPPAPVRIATSASRLDPG